MKNTLIDVAMKREKADVVLKNVRIFNVFTMEFEQGDIAVKDGYIAGIGQYEGIKNIDLTGKTIVPGFIDAHMHLESSIVAPCYYSNAVISHGTTGIVADPHEIANVCGPLGIEYMLDVTKNTPIDVFFMIPSCVPASPFDESGFVIDSDTVSKLMENERVLGLAEMMNYPGVIYNDSEVLKKLEHATNAEKNIDGHAPGLLKESLNAYVAAGVESDHECTDYNEALEKLSRGQWIMIREGTASKNLDSLCGLIKEPLYNRCLFATDDKHPGDLIEQGHIDYIIKKAIESGADAKYCYKVATYNAATYFKLSKRGAIAPGYIADIVVLNDFDKVDISCVFKNGECIFDKEKSFTKVSDKYDMPDKYKTAIMDTIHINDISAKDFILSKNEEKVIGLVEGQIITTDEGYSSEIDVNNDICKLAVIERHHNTGHIGLSFIKGYGLKNGAIATSIAHDSHNIIVVGTNEEDMAYAVNELKKINGGMIVVNNKKVLDSLSLPIAGLMCDMSAKEAEKKMTDLKKTAYELGVNPSIDPFMTLSFTSLPVIPALKLTTLGVVDVNKFELI